ncbi:Oxysterol-binding protein-domain-containing protein [Rhodocollybia butyracea]|uniref:Oxysterol-binding protein-domain-containing protein n=1 Tax=Rhodocollybia butyracea TaxID=206335 RepID=A0A9P5PW12_9AGAR|nr:Oxysterol-binding protein-domain-containing protein [Rhodocollybia butyracea]
MASNISSTLEHLDQLTLLSAIRSGDEARISEFLGAVGTEGGREEYDARAAVLHLAIRCSSVSTIAFLLGTISPNAIHPPGSGTTPLHVAAEMGKADIIGLLLEQGADDVTPDSQGRTVDDIVAKNGAKDVQKVIKDSRAFLSASYRSLLHSYTQSPSQSTTQLTKLLTSPRRVHLDLAYREPTTGTTLLHQAARQADLQLCELILLGAPATPAVDLLFVRDSNGKTVLDLVGKSKDRVGVFLKQFVNQMPAPSRSSSMAASVTGPPPTLKGYLNKYTNVAKGYNTRWFVLRGGILSYYRHQQDETVASRGSISMKTAVMKVNSDKLRFEIHSSAPSKSYPSSNSGIQKWYVKTTHPAETARWIGAIGASLEWYQRQSHNSPQAEEAGAREIEANLQPKASSTKSAHSRASRTSSSSRVDSDGASASNSNSEHSMANNALTASPRHTPTRPAVSSHHSHPSPSLQSSPYSHSTRSSLSSTLGLAGLSGLNIRKKNKKNKDKNSRQAQGMYPVTNAGDTNTDNMNTNTNTNTNNWDNGNSDIDVAPGDASDNHKGIPHDEDKSSETEENDEEDNEEEGLGEDEVSEFSEFSTKEEEELEPLPYSSTFHLHANSIIAQMELLAASVAPTLRDPYSTLVTSTKEFIRMASEREGYYQQNQRRLTPLSSSSSASRASDSSSPGLEMTEKAKRITDRAQRNIARAQRNTARAQRTTDIAKQHIARSKRRDLKAKKTLAKAHRAMHESMRMVEVVVKEGEGLEKELIRRKERDRECGGLRGWVMRMEERKAEANSVRRKSSHGANNVEDTLKTPLASSTSTTAVENARTWMLSPVRSDTGQTITQNAAALDVDSGQASEVEDEEDEDEDEDEFFDAIESNNILNLVIPEPLQSPTDTVRTIQGVKRAAIGEGHFNVSPEASVLVAVKDDRTLKSVSSASSTGAGPSSTPDAFFAPYVGYTSLRTALTLASERPVTSLCFPVYFNEPTSMLQRMAEDMEFSECLDIAASEPDPLRRIAYVAAFAMSNYSSTIGRIAKPFNPMLGETFEYVHIGDSYAGEDTGVGSRVEAGAVKKQGYRYVSEQVSHHPPISACWAESFGFLQREDGQGGQTGRGVKGSWRYYGEVDAQNKFMGRVLRFVQRGRSCGVKDSEAMGWVAKAKWRAGASGSGGTDDGAGGETVLEHYSWKKVTTNVSGFILGSPTIDHYGDMIVTNHLTKDRCILTFKPRGWRGKDAYEISGQISNASGKVAYEIAGRWNSQLIARPASSSNFSSSGNLNPDTSILTPAHRSPFNLTPFALTLNDCPKSTLKPVRVGLYELANNLKGMQEDKQRATRKKREAGELEGHRPRWFKPETDGDTGERVWMPARGERERVWRETNVQSVEGKWRGVDSIFIDEPEAIR